MQMYLFWFSLAAGVLAIILAIVFLNKVSKYQEGTEAMIEIAAAIRGGAMAFLKREYQTLSFFVLVVAIVLAVFIQPATAVCFLAGAISSVLAGYIGMNSATKANVRTAWAAKDSIENALQVAFTGGAVLGLVVVGIGLFGLVGIFLILNQIFAHDL
ncbi:MAG: sodium-translocating pyrophosphatase, partial [Calditrichaeota bacterium]|nr:sodium-translocating pyrophosphatase [Calditrichota bacterium]